MNSVSRKRGAWAGTLLTILAALFLAKFVWVVLSWRWLPAEGVDRPRPMAGAPLHYRYRLASNDKLPTAPRPAPTRPKPALPSLSGYRLLGIYNDPGSTALAVIAKGGQNKVLAVGERFHGYRLKRIEERAALFEKNGRELRLELPRKALGKGVLAPSDSPSAPSAQNPDAAAKSTIEAVGENTRIVPRTLISRYTKDPRRIWKDVGITPEKKEGKITGFRVRFVRRGSDFSKLGLKRGDVITAVNGESLESPAAALELMQNIDSINGITLTIRRGNEEKELEYEIR